MSIGIGIDFGFECELEIDFLHSRSNWDGKSTLNLHLDLTDNLQLKKN